MLHDGVFYNISITSILAVPTDTDELKLAKIEAYFKQFGEIVAIKKNRSYYGHNPSVNIIFKTPAAAKNALTYEAHKTYEVSVSDLWLQPLISNDKNDDAKESELTVAQDTSITDLNDDCLLKIFAELNSRDQLALALSDFRFQNAYEMYAKFKYKSLETSELRLFSKWQLQQFFIIVGKFIEMLSCDKVKNIAFVLQLATEYCGNMKALFVWKLTDLETYHLDDLLINRTNLKILFLNKCHIHDETIALIAYLQQLEILTLRHCKHIRGRYLWLPNLRELNIIKCHGLNHFNINHAIERMPNLTTLTLDDGYCGNLTLVVQNLSHFAKNLVTLNLRCIGASYKCVENMEKLKSINFCDLGDENFLPKFSASSTAKQIEALAIDGRSLEAQQRQLLEKFENVKKFRYSFVNEQCYFEPLHALKNLEHICFYECQINNKSLLELVINCKNLKYVDLHNAPIDNGFVTSLLPVLKYANRPNGQLKFQAHLSNIDKHQLSKEYFTKEVESLVKFVFDEPKRTSFMYITMPFKHYDSLDNLLKFG